MSETKDVRIEVDKEVWQKIKAKASLQGKNVKDFAGEIFEREVEDFEFEA
ncbi:MAG: hypothetical protein BTN85_1988 [Candidatus Methanohalarchaeum thermophilum]|uniref:Uncharacterized protein n=1 Tax=Methanohalarchaeum thermophilum TaxID=1903181 RepID=A0A1Q6DSM2_METT1|nr:MAG: hypothetical protein BTN85_1988 [Candidatus Methanohalarchaeum thermophilum]